MKHTFLVSIMTVVSSNGVGLVDKDNVGKGELGPTHFALVVLVGHDQRSRVGIGFAGTLKITTVLISSPARFDLIVKVGLRLRA